MGESPEICLSSGTYHVGSPSLFKIIAMCGQAFYRLFYFISFFLEDGGGGGGHKNLGAKVFCYVNPREL